MLKKLFENKKFIFIFCFMLEIVSFFLFEHIPIGGEYFFPDIGLDPIIGLMFGPVGALGQSIANLIFELIDGMDPIGSLIDSGITFFISILTYKLWYTTLTGKKINTPRIDSTYNLLKLLCILSIVSITYLILIDISFEAYSRMYLIYPLSSVTYRVSYVLNMFNYSIIFALFFISLSNILQIPLQTPKKWFAPLNIKNKYFIISFIALTIYIIIVQVFNYDNDLTDAIFFILSMITAISFSLNKFEVNIETKPTNYSIIEKIILFFLIILFLTFSALFSEFLTVGSLYAYDLNYDYVQNISLSYVLILIIIFCIIHTHYIEKTMTKPIYGLIESITQYQENNSMNINSFKSRFKKYLKNNDDISRLLQSFISLNENIDDSLTNIKKTTSENEKIETEFNIAHNIQLGMIKTDFDEFSNNRPFEIYGFMNPAKEVGGDFYDYFDIDDENIAFVIGDVSGKGVPATLFMVKTMHLIENHSKFDSSPEEIFNNVNNISCNRNEEELFVTSWFGKLNLNSGKLSFINAGHNPPLIKQNHKDFEYLNTEPNFVLGEIEDIPFEEQEIDLNPGDIILLYTDGITEANDNYAGFYGENRLRKIINDNKNKSLEEILGNIKDDVYRFCGSTDQFDDMTMLCIKYNGQ